jgi:hypothetical protein
LVEEAEIVAIGVDEEADGGRGVLLLMPTTWVCTEVGKFSGVKEV